VQSPHSPGAGKGLFRSGQQGKEIAIKSFDIVEKASNTRRRSCADSMPDSFIRMTSPLLLAAIIVDLLYSGCEEVDPQGQLKANEVFIG
jgi:hypothetical protein